MDRTKYMIIDCKRRPLKRDCTVLLCKDSLRNKRILKKQAYESKISKENRECKPFI